MSPPAMAAPPPVSRPSHATPPEPREPEAPGFPRALDSDGHRRRILICAALAFGLHAALLFWGRHAEFSGAEFAMAGDDLPAVDVELVSGEPVAEPAEAPPPEPEPPTPEPPPEPQPPEPEPEPVTPPEPEEMAEPEPPKPAPRPEPPKPKARAASRPAATPSRAVAAARSATAGAPGAATGANSGSGVAGAGRPSSKPGYLSNPRPPYPAASRAAREQGTVLLRVKVSAQGRPESVSVQQSSGFPRLDAAAAEGVRRWRFKPATSGGVPVAAPVTVPIRFNLAQ